MKAKTFDCVQMKHDIQKRIMAELQPLSPEEQRERSEQRILADPILGRLWRRAEKAVTSTGDKGK